MNFDTKVSIIIPVFNAVSFLKDTVDSVVNQTYKNIEIIIIDDASEDGSLQLANTFLDSRIKVIENPRKGACAARNYGFQLATGTYIQYLDSDDILSLDKIEKQLVLSKNFGNDTLFSCKWMPFVSDIKMAEQNRQLINKDYINPYSWLNDTWKGFGMGQTSIWLTHKQLIEKSGGWDETLKLNQDGEFFSRVILEAQQIKFSEEAIVFYRKGNPNSVSQLNSRSKEKALSLLKSYISYKNSAIKYCKLDELKKGLGNNFLTFIDQYYNDFPELSTQAEDEFYTLGFAKMWPVGGGKFKKMASLIGFKNALKLRKLLN
jgi:glycosyltransferase involved in cell wall biosynthesis